MSTTEKLFMRIQESEDCSICMNIIEIKDKVITEQCSHVYCYACLVKWYKNNPICPLDRLQLERVFVFNHVKANVEIVEIIKVISQCIYSERENDIQFLSKEFNRTLLAFIENYKCVISISDAIIDVYDIFTENAFQKLLDMDSKDSNAEFNYFLQTIVSLSSKFSSEFDRFYDTIKEKTEMIHNNENLLQRAIEACGDNIKLLAYHSDLVTFDIAFLLLSEIYQQYIDIIYTLFQLYKTMQS